MKILLIEDNEGDILLTTEALEECKIKLETYQAHANCYIIKPFEVAEFVNVACKIEEFWFGTAILPNN